MNYRLRRRRLTRLLFLCSYRRHPNPHRVPQKDRQYWKNRRYLLH